MRLRAGTDANSSDKLNDLFIFIAPSLPLFPLPLLFFIPFFLFSILHFLFFPDSSSFTASSLPLPHHPLPLPSVLPLFTSHHITS